MHILIPLKMMGMVKKKKKLTTRRNDINKRKNMLWKT